MLRFLLLFLLPVFLTRTPISPPPYDESRASVVRVVDGDTIIVRVAGFYERTIRYIGIDAPENTRRKDCFGQQASEVNSFLINGKTLRLERDKSDTDRYGRLLRYVYLPDGVMVNEALVRMGAAIARSYPPDTRYQERLRLAESQARAEGKGLWGACRITPTPLPSATPAVLPTSPPAQMLVPTLTVITERLRVRAGPGTNYQEVGQLLYNAVVIATGRSIDWRWWQIDYQGRAAWISADYVLASPDAYALPAVNAPPPPALPPPSPAPPIIGQPNPTAPSPSSSPITADQPNPMTQPTLPSTAAQPTIPPVVGACPMGCIEQPPGCAIKGNVNSRGERIYHVPGSRYYDRTLVNPAKGDRWFCTVAEAEANGFRAPLR